jgi:hypothetical protein
MWYENWKDIIAHIECTHLKVVYQGVWNNLSDQHFFQDCGESFQLWTVQGQVSKLLHFLIILSVTQLTATVEENNS